MEIELHAGSVVLRLSKPGSLWVSLIECVQFDSSGNINAITMHSSPIRSLLQATPRFRRHWEIVAGSFGEIGKAGETVGISGATEPK